MQTPPVFAAPADAIILVSKANPFARYAGPVSFERLESSHPPIQFWRQMQAVFKTEGITVDDGPTLLDPNYAEVREERQQSFKILGVPQIPLASPAFNSHARIRGAHIQIFLGSNGHGGSIMEFWVMDKFQ